MTIADIYELDIKNPMRIMPGGDPLRHVVYGLAIYLVLCLLPRQRVGGGMPLAFLAVLEALNETADRVHYGSWRWPDTSGDILNTLAIPVAFTLLLRFVNPNGPNWSWVRRSTVAG